MLPNIKANTPERKNFPQLWQTVIFRNYRMVPSEKIAKVLGCTVEDIDREAARMGLRTGEADPKWLTRGYITIIRNNWNVLPYEQIQTLVGMTDEQFDFVINKEDFLWVKLGKYKLECEAVHYSPLTDEEIARTEEIAKTVKALDTSERKMFDFFADTADTEPQYFVSSDGGTRIVHGFLTSCGDVFIEDTRTNLPDSLLDAYARQNVNALFVHAVLSQLSPYRFDPEQSRDYKIRRENLRDLIRRAALRGIKIYLYFNEPRALMLDVYERYGKPEIGGGVYQNMISMCLQADEPREYLYEATKDLFEDVKGIGGIFTITRSENETHCHTRQPCTCPRCSKMPETKEQFPVMVNNIMHQAIRDAGSNAQVIAYVWAWYPFLDDAALDRAFAALHPEIAIMQVSENSLPINKGGIDGKIEDYSISNPGPSPISEYVFRVAAKHGHKTFAKVQMCNSWECSSVPYLPVFDTELKHLKQLHDVGVDNYMLTWTLGGYPSITYDMVADYMANPDGFNIDGWYNKQFGENGEAVHAAIKMFCEGFEQYPFSIFVLYYSPKNLGPANMWSLTKNDRTSSMVCYAYDDYETWCNPYPVEVYLSQLEKLLHKWECGCKMLSEVATDEKTQELLLFARFATLMLRSDVIHTKYAICKRDLAAKKGEMREIFREERELTKTLLSLMEKSSLIGFETSNHYFFTERDFIEKLVSLDALERELEAF